MVGDAQVKGVRSKTGVSVEIKLADDAKTAMVFLRTGYWGDGSVDTKTAGDIVMTGEDWVDRQQILALISQKFMLETMADWVLQDLYRSCSITKRGKVRVIRKRKVKLKMDRMKRRD